MVKSRSSASLNLIFFGYVRGRERIVNPIEPGVMTSDHIRKHYRAHQKIQTSLEINHHGKVPYRSQAV